MKLLEEIGKCWKMDKVMLTVFKGIEPKCQCTLLSQSRSHLCCKQQIPRHSIFILKSSGKPFFLLTIMAT